MAAEQLVAAPVAKVIKPKRKKSSHPRAVHMTGTDVTSSPAKKSGKSAKLKKNESKVKKTREAATKAGSKATSTQVRNAKAGAAQPGQTAVPSRKLQSASAPKKQSAANLAASPKRMNKGQTNRLRAKKLKKTS